MWFVQYHLAAQLNAHLVCTLLKFRHYANKYDTLHFHARHKYKRKSSAGVVCWTHNDAEIFYQWVLRDGFNLRWMWTPGKSGTAIVSSTLSEWSRCSSLSAYTCAGPNARRCSEALCFLHLPLEPFVNPGNVSCRHHMDGWGKLFE